MAKILIENNIFNGKEEDLIIAAAKLCIEKIQSSETESEREYFRSKLLYLFKKMGELPD